jgi:hypothetical protein
MIFTNTNDPQLFHAASELKKAERIGRKIVLKLVCDLWTEPQGIPSEMNLTTSICARGRSLKARRDQLSEEVRNLGYAS